MGTCPHCGSINYVEGSKRDVEFTGFNAEDEQIEIWVEVSADFCTDCGYVEIYN